MSDRAGDAEEGSGVRLGNALLRKGVLTAEQLRDALVEHAKHPSGSFPEFLLRRGLATREQIEAETRPEPEALASFGKYDLLREIGRGGMGVVYEARDRELGRVVALKLMLGRRDRPMAPQDEDRFLREARLVAALPRHPAIVGVFEAGSVGDRRFISMELVRGEPFSTWRTKADLRRQAEVLRDAALAVHHAHAHGVIHRDLKPDNILVDAEGKPHVTDFGLAKAVGQDAQVSLTAEGMVVGTPAYMSPEQAQGLRSVDARTDLWALGVLLYEALTGRQPFVGDTAVEILVKASKNAVPSPSRIVQGGLKGIDPAAERICLKALQKRADDRYASAADFAADLSRWLAGEEVRAKPSSVRVPPSPAAPRTARWIALGAALAAAAAVVAFAARPSRVAPPSGSPPAPAPSRPFGIPILGDVDPVRDALAGVWKKQDGALLSESRGLSVLTLPYEPAGEYDVRVEFTPMGEVPDINVIAIAGGRPFQWYVGAQNSTWYGFGKIDGDPAFGHPTGTRMAGLMVSGRRHATRLEVRKDRITGYLDGRPLASLDLAGRSLDVSLELLPRNRTCLGLVTYKNPTLFHSVEVVPR
jgi:predicted Ser/Thr protein kinase